MKFLSLLTLAAALLSMGCFAVHAASPGPSDQASAASVGQTLCGLLDLSTPGLEQVRKAADAGRYADALNAWRDYQVRKLRQGHLGELSFHDYRINPRWLATADRLVGKTDQAQYSAYLGGVNFQDIYGMSGAPGTTEPINWLATTEDPLIKDKVEYANFYFAIPLASDYWKTGDPVYAEKWFEVASDFAVNQKRMIEAAGPQAQTSFVANWSLGAQPTLSEGDRAQAILGSLAVIAKSLPGDGKTADWDKIDLPVPPSAAVGDADLIPAVPLAQIAIALVQDYPPTLLKRYGSAGAVPNQRRNGLTALLEIAVEFGEFKAARTLGSDSAAAMTDYIDSAVYPDGGMLEQSFNYNESDAASIDHLEPIIQPSYPALAELLTRKIALFRRLLAALTMPDGGLPVVGNAHPDNPPRLWNKDSASTPAPQADFTVLASAASASQGSGIVPAFTSVAFPYSGYCAMRRDWSLTSAYLFFMSARPARGHHMMDDNSIQVSAYGRPMLVAAGPPPYAPSFLAPDKRADFNQINAYLGEDTSYKVNTVLVDDRSQSRDASEAQQAYTTPIPHIWHTSAHFDVTRGLYDLGYGDVYAPYKRNLKIDSSVQHERTVIFLRDAGLWIVTDHMINTGTQEHLYSQEWHLPPYYVQDAHPIYGYAEDQVITDPAAHDLHTADPDGPNVWLYQFGAQPLEYVKYYGQTSPYRGWFARGIGDVIPAADVHINWKSARDTLLTTAICPTPSNISAVLSIRDLSNPDDSQNTFQLVTRSGTHVFYAASANARSWTAGSISAVSSTLMTVESGDGVVRGITLGCKSLTVNGKIQTFESPDFEWELSDTGAFRVAAPITQPGGFAWQTTAEGLMPSYSAGRF